MNTFDWKSKNLWLGVAALLVVVLLIVVLSKRNGQVVTEPQPEASVSETGNAVTEEATTKPAVRPNTKATTKAASVQTSKLSYAEALNKYRDFRLQFDSGCVAVPNTVTYKNGTEIMIDNRAAVARKFFIDSTFTVEAYDFKIVKLSSDTLPKTLLVDCGDKQNVATILIQR